MADNKFDLGSFIGRWVFAIVLVFSTYNPTEYCYVQWVAADLSDFGPEQALAGITLLIGWIVFLRATFLSLGWLGISLFAAFFGCFIWLLVDQELLSLESTSALTWIVLVILSLVLATGMSWSHIRRRLSGQVSVDDVED